MLLRIRNLLLLGIAFTLLACQNDKQADSQTYISLQGETMGTYYRITYKDPEQRNFQQAIDSLLLALNQEVSTYIPSSMISNFNQSVEGILLSEGGKQKNHFLENLKAAAEIFTLTEGAFDPTIMPLGNYWGFGYTPRKPVTKVDSNLVDSLLDFVGFEKLQLVEEGERVKLNKRSPGIQLDFSALAKGYGVDAIGNLLKENEVNDFLVEIGGEVVARGLNKKGEPWSIGINQPSETSDLTDFVAIIPLENKGMATSGNYRNFYEVNGVKYSHTINPHTGFPERNTLLSATIIANNCMYADALATACMVLGTEAAFELINSLQDVDAYLIYGLEDGSLAEKYTPGLSDIFN